MSKLTILLGPSHTGKSSALLDRLEQHMHRGERAVLLVPEQATYHWEQRLCARLGGLIGIEVYSFERLSQRLIGQYGRSLPYLSDQGRCMVLRRAAYRRQNDLSLFGKAAQRKGFASSMDQMIGRFQQNCISPDDLELAASRLGEHALLKQKLSDFSVLYRESESFLKSRFQTSNDLISIADALIGESWLKEAHVYVDDFNQPFEQVYHFLLSLIKTARSVTMTLRSSNDPDLCELFAPDQKIHDRLVSVCVEQSIPYFEQEMSKLSASPDPALLHLESNLFSSHPKQYCSETSAIQIIASKDRAAEVSTMADRILEMVRSGKRFSDFAVIASDLNAYAPLVQRAFRVRDIPLFYDAKRPVSGLVSIDYVIASARAACLGMSISDILRIVKSGYASVTRDEMEIFENYVLRYGIYGSEIGKPFSVGEIPQEAEFVRARLAETLLPLKDAMREKKTSQKIRALWNYLKANRLREQLEAEARTLSEDGFEENAQLTAQVWNMIKDLLVQLDTVLGDTEITLPEFPMLLEEGVSGFTIGILPSQSDAVTLGDLIRTRIEPVSHIFILGCNEGMFPPVHSDDDLINDPELEALKALGLSVWGDTKSLTASDRLALYSLLSKARESVFFSYACSDGNKELLCSSLLSSIKGLFPSVQLQEKLLSSPDMILCKPIGFAVLSERLQNLVPDDQEREQISSLLEYFRTDPDYSDAVQAITSGSDGKTSPGSFGRKVAKELYGSNPKMSASRLEQYARCPFAQYLKYGLNAEERKVAEETAADAGTFYHDVLDQFVKDAMQKDLNWKTATEQDVEPILEEVVSRLSEEHNDGIFTRNPRLKESRFLRDRLIHTCAISILRQLQSGQFQVSSTEMSFGTEGGTPPILLDLPDGQQVRVYGKIDRVDRTENGKYIRIIDYKTGKSHTFDPTKLLSGETIQLPLYYAAVRAADKAAEKTDGECAGIYYMPLSLDPPEEGESPLHKLYGLTASEEEAVRCAEHFDSSSSLIHNLKRSKKGEITGAVAPIDRFKEILSDTEKIAANLADGILSGNAELYPTEKACDWCPYTSVCRFDTETGCRKRYVKKVTLSDLLDGKEGSDNAGSES